MPLALGRALLARLCLLPVASCPWIHPLTPRLTLEALGQGEPKAMPGQTALEGSVDERRGERTALSETHTKARQGSCSKGSVPFSIPHAAVLAVLVLRRGQ